MQDAFLTSRKYRISFFSAIWKAFKADAILERLNMKRFLKDFIDKYANSIEKGNLIVDEFYNQILKAVSIVEMSVRGYNQIYNQN